MFRRTATTRLPTGQGPTMTAVTSSIYWQSTQPTRFFTLGVGLSVYSGKPVTITTGGDDNHDGILNDRPAGVPRNSMRGPGEINLDVTLSHDFALSKTHKEARVLSVSLNSFNVLNHRNDVTYIGTITSKFFGHAVVVT